MELEANSSKLGRAATEGNYEELCELLRTPNLDKNAINQALYQAVSNSQSASDHLRCVEVLLGNAANPNYKDANSVSLLMIAAKLGQIQLAELLINSGSLVEDKDRENRTPLMYAVESCYGDNVDVVELLLHNKAKVNFQDNNGNSALHRSAERGYANSMSALLDFGAFKDAENKEKETPLHLASKYSYEQCVELLLQRKANTHIKNSAGKTPIDIAPDNIKHLFEAPLDCTSDSSFCSLSSHNEIICKICKKSVVEGICKPCHENNLHYNVQTFQENIKLIEQHVKEISELKSNNLELNKKLKNKSETCKSYKRFIDDKENEIKRKDNEINSLSAMLKDQLNKKIEENKELSVKIIEFEDEIESLKEQIINLKNEVKFHRNDSEVLRKRLEESKLKESDNLYSLKRAPKKINFSYLRPSPLIEKFNMTQVVREEIYNFMQELEKWQEEVDSIYMDLTRKIKRIIKKKFPSSNVELYGSYATRLHLPSSDIDMVITSIEGDKREILRSVEKILKTQPYVKNTNFIHQAFVPVIKIKSEMMGKVVQIDITVSDSNHSGIKCLGVVNRILQQNSMIKPIFIILKELLYVCGFKEPFTGGLGSYSLFLMVASFVQEHQEYCETNKIEKTIADYLLSTLGNYSDERAYSYPIVASDPGNGTTGRYPAEREPFNSYSPFVIVVDPLNSMNNVAHNTHADRLIHIFRTAHYNLKRTNLCDCALSSSPLYRMLYDTKENIGN
jgi:ankyrin repeat protein/predicted nucleotidyltransferase